LALALTPKRPSCLSERPRPRSAADRLEAQLAEGADWRTQNRALHAELERAQTVAPTAWRAPKLSSGSTPEALQAALATREAGGERQADDLRAAENQLLDALASRGQLQEQLESAAGQMLADSLGMTRRQPPVSSAKWNPVASWLLRQREELERLRGELADARSQLAESAEAQARLDTVSKALDEKDAPAGRRAGSPACSGCWNQRSARIEASEPSWRPLAADRLDALARLAQLRGALKSAIDRDGCSPTEEGAGAASADDGGIDWAALERLISGLSANMTEATALAVRSRGQLWRAEEQAERLKEACGKADDALQSGETMPLNRNRLLPTRRISSAIRAGIYFVIEKSSIFLTLCFFLMSP
uniref:KASH domain-containing protein n=1 Tax=Macrostomum lignano TaxID=282301 RepID=A0A1I8FR04_9PLAT